MFDSPIDRFAKKLYSACVSRLMPPDPEVARRWDENPLHYLGSLVREVKPMPDHLRPLMQEAIRQWDGIETKVLRLAGKDRRELLDLFGRLHDGLRTVSRHAEGGPHPRLSRTFDRHLWCDTCIAFGCVLCNAVRNLDWVDCFARYLPSADAANARPHFERGRRMLAIFALDRLGHYLGEKTVRPEDLGSKQAIRSIDVRWAYLASLKAGTSMHTES